MSYPLNYLTKLCLFHRTPAVPISFFDRANAFRVIKFPSCI